MVYLEDISQVPRFLFQPILTLGTAFLILLVACMKLCSRFVKRQIRSSHAGNSMPNTSTGRYWFLYETSECGHFETEESFWKISFSSIPIFFNFSVIPGFQNDLLIDFHACPFLLIYSYFKIRQEIGNRHCSKDRIQVKMIIL